MSFESHPWKMILKGTHAEEAQMKCLTSLGNGYMGVNDADTWIGGIETPDQNAPHSVRCMNLQGLRIEIDGEMIDWNHGALQEQVCELDLQTGILQRRFQLATAKGCVKFHMEQFVSMAQKELLAICCRIHPDYDAYVKVSAFLDARSSDDLWEYLAEEENEDGAALLVRIKENEVGVPCTAVSAAMSCWTDGLELVERSYESGYAEAIYAAQVEAGDEVMLEKHVLCFTSREYEQNVLTTVALRAAARARELGYDEMKDAQIGAWKAHWANCDVQIDGDEAAQQQIRYALFRLWSAYAGEEIGAFGMDDRTGALPFYLAAAEGDAAKQLLVYEKGDEQQHIRLAYALFAYATFTGDFEWLRKEGLSILCAIARFFHQRASEVELEGFMGRMAAWCIGLFLTQMHRASSDRVTALDLTKTETAEMLELVQKLHQPENRAELDEETLLELYYLNHLFDGDSFRKLYEQCDSAAEPQNALSACVHCVLAAQSGETEKAFDMYRKILSLAEQTPAGWATGWMALVQGFGGVRTAEGLSLCPTLPAAWQSYAFRMRYRGRLLAIRVQPGKTEIEILDGQPLVLTFYGEEIRLEDRAEHTF